MRPCAWAEFQGWAWTDWGGVVAIKSPSRTVDFTFDLYNTSCARELLALAAYVFKICIF